MSSFGANQTNSQLNVTTHSNPSIFEVLAAQSLESGLRRAANHLKNILYSNNSQTFNLLLKNFDEIYLLVDICVQLSHFQSFSASFSEHFYSLKRVSVQTNNGLNRKQIYSSLVMLTVFPYLKSKIDILFENLKSTQMERQLIGGTERDSQVFKKIFVKSYPTIRSLLQLVCLYYQMSYSVGQNIYCSPILRLLGIRLINLEEKDFKENRTILPSVDPNIDWVTYFARLSVSTTKLLAKSFSVSLSVGAFFIQFLDYWYSSDNSTTSFAPLPIPPPPSKFETEMPSDLCPICLRHRENDSALITSGFVFCYSCITQYLRDYSRCPVTGYPSTPNQIIKIFATNQ